MTSPGRVHPVERPRRILHDGEVRRPEVVQVPDEQVVTLSGLARLVLAEVSVRRAVPPAAPRRAALPKAALRGGGRCGSPRRLPCRGRERGQFFFGDAPRQARKDVGQVLDGVDAEQGARRADRVRDGGALSARV